MGGSISYPGQTAEKEEGAVGHPIDNCPGFGEKLEDGWVRYSESSQRSLGGNTLWRPIRPVCHLSLKTLAEHPHKGGAPARMRTELEERDRREIDGGRSKQKEDRSRDDRGSRYHESGESSSPGSKRPRDHHDGAQNGKGLDPNLGTLEDDPRIDSRGVKHVRKRGMCVCHKKNQTPKRMETPCTYRNTCNIPSMHSCHGQPCPNLRSACSQPLVSFLLCSETV